MLWLCRFASEIVVADTCMFNYATLEWFNDFEYMSLQQGQGDYVLIYVRCVVWLCSFSSHLWVLFRHIILVSQNIFELCLCMSEFQGNQGHEGKTNNFRSGQIREFCNCEKCSGKSENCLLNVRNVTNVQNKLMVNWWSSKSLIVKCFSLARQILNIVQSNVWPTHISE